MSKAETLKYYSNLSSDTVAKMKQIRSAFIKLAAEVESLGNSRELSEAFTHIETAQMYAIKHLCMVDPQAVREDTV